MTLDPYIERFRQLAKTWTRPPIGGRREKQMLRIQFLMAQLEMYILAQAICRKHAPAIQDELDETRCQVMAELKKQTSSHTSIVKPYKSVSHIRWSDFQITPEVAGDSELTGLLVSHSTAKRLRKAHREQVKKVMEIVKDGN